MSRLGSKRCEPIPAAPLGSSPAQRDRVVAQQAPVGTAFKLPAQHGLFYPDALVPLNRCPRAGRRLPPRACERRCTSGCWPLTRSWPSPAPAPSPPRPPPAPLEARRPPWQSPPRCHGCGRPPRRLAATRGAQGLASPRPSCTSRQVGGGTVGSSSDHVHLLSWISLSSTAATTCTASGPCPLHDRNRRLLLVPSGARGVGGRHHRGARPRLLRLLSSDAPQHAAMHAHRKSRIK